MTMSTRQLGGSRSALLLSSSIAIFLSSLWRNKVNQVVPSPYLDEVFHVGQAKAYWDGHWRHWDPKITTPPGLYVWSFLDLALASCLRLKRAAGSTLEFRATNGLVLFNLFQLRLRKLLGHVRGQFTEAQGRRKICFWELNWTALNICLFPPIFFFSALYYTDLAALYLVLEAYIQEKQQEQERTWSFSRDLKLVAMGLLALCFRQTNVFWVAVFLGGLRAVNLLHSLTAKCQSNDLRRILQGSYGLQQLYDPPAKDASLADYFKTSLSFGVAGMVNGFAVLKALSCYLICVVAFGFFVLWNGSVVLGHKEFHSASIHIPQMLYIWPYIMFFSWPLFIIPFAVTVGRSVRAKSPLSSSAILPNPFVIGVIILLMALTVHFNTIVHPFTLADNRHYVFYVFRILLRHPAIKYAVTPIYAICAWASISTLSGRWSNHAITEIPRSLSKKEEKPEKTTGEGEVRVSFVLIWLLTTTLSLISAPLVEPRYFIIPWVIWRLHVPPPPIEDKARTARILRNLPFLLESLWYVAINAVVSYVFLYKGFEWPQEPGVIQRFMW